MRFRIGIFPNGSCGFFRYGSQHIRNSFPACEVPSIYYSLDDAAKFIPENFRITGIYGLAVLFPPYLAGVVKSGIAKRIISAAERAICFLPFFRTHGDEILIVARRYA